MAGDLSINISLSAECGFTGADLYPDGVPENLTSEDVKAMLLEWGVTTAILEMGLVDDLEVRVSVNDQPEVVVRR